MFPVIISALMILVTLVWIAPELTNISDNLANICTALQQLRKGFDVKGLQHDLIIKPR